MIYVAWGMHSLNVLLQILLLSLISLMAQLIIHTMLFALQFSVLCEVPSACLTPIDAAFTLCGRLDVVDGLRLGTYHCLFYT